MLPVLEKPLFFLDYDGTLAPIVQDPMRAYPHPDAKRLLAALDARFPLWIVTGRHLRDLADLLGLSLRAVGLHGMQEGRIGRDVRSLVPDDAVEVIAGLRASVPHLQGVRVEDKGPTFAVHYRGAPDEREARRRLSAWVAAGPPVDVDVVWGKKVVELRPKGIDKGVAVRRIARAHPGRVPVYIGDDVTDEDAFRALPPPAVTVKVGAGETAARFRLPDVEAVAAYLERYLIVRP